MHDHLVAAPDVGARMPRDVMDSDATAKGGGDGVRAGAPRAAAGSGVSGNWTVAATRRAFGVRFPPLWPNCRSAVVAGGGGRGAGGCAAKGSRSPRSDVLRRDDTLADRHDAIHRDGLPPRVREVA